MNKKLINLELIGLDIEINDRDSTIKVLADMINDDNRLNNVDDFIKEVMNREEKSTTGIGEMLAIPHGKCSAVNIPTVAFGRLKNGVDWKALDDRLVTLVFLIAVPDESETNKHLKILAALSRKLMDNAFKDQLLKAESKELVLEHLNQVFKLID